MHFYTLNKLFKNKIMDERNNLIPINSLQTAMQELINKVEHAISYNVEGGLVKKYTWEELSNDMYILLEKEKDSIPIQPTKTAVEWLATYLKGITSLNCDEVIEQAKQMEKEQIIEAFWNGDNTDCLSEQNLKEFAEQYYNKTFKQ